MGKINGQGGLQEIVLEGYALGLRERITAQVVLSYLKECGEDMARELMRKTMTPRILRLFGEAGADAPSILQADIEGVQLAALIDLAAGEMHTKLEEELLTEPMGAEAVEIRRAVMSILEQIDGQAAVMEISTEFLDFLSDCYRAVRY